MSSTLIAHNPRFESRLIPYSALKDLSAPVVLGPQHRPVPHVELVDTIIEESTRRGLVITRQQFALGAKGDALFGVLDFKPTNLPVIGDPSAQGLSFGFRSANNKSLAIKGVAGSRVFVCDNLALSGDLVAFARKHTSGINLVQEIRQGFDKFLGQAEVLASQLQTLTNHEITDVDAKVLVFDAFAKKFLPGSKFDDVVTNYFDVDATARPDCEPRTLWGLHNAFTRSIRTLPPVTAFNASVNIGRHFGLSKTATDAPVIDVETVN